MKKLFIVLFIFPFISNAQYVTQGNCTQYANTFNLNSVSQDPYSGRFFNTTPVNLNSNFDLVFSVYMGSIYNDGLAFVFFPGSQPTSSYPTYNSGADNVHNFATGSINTDFVVEFDMRGSFCGAGQNQSYEPISDINHVSYWKNNSACNFGNYFSPYSALGTINYYTFEPYRIKWTKSTNTLETYYNNNLIKSNNIDLVGLLGTSVYWGFSAACYCVPGSPQVNLTSLNGQTVLPLSLSDFTAEKNNGNIKLNWQTSQEQNTSHFIIEKSSDGTHFYFLKEVAAAGNSNVLHSYTATDPSPLYGTNFYRIKMLDLDGKYSYSKIVAVKMDDKNTGLSIFPNPVNKELQVQIASPSKEKAILRILDIAGRVLQEQKIQLNGTVISTSMNVTGLQQGTYQLEIIYSDRKEVKQFIRQ
ncbi:MAG: T9SS type A sorting domain-containing protein [Ferruginibacter sp.]